MNRSIRGPALVLVAAVAGCGGPRSTAVAPWPEADALFRGDPRWIGGDGAYSIDLGHGRHRERVLWLFGDSFVDPEGSGRRDRSTMVRNTVAIQTGRDPVAASLSFHWGPEGTDEKPDAYFPGPDAETWRWPLHGIRVRDALLIFFMDTQESPGEGLGFKTVGWSVARIGNADADAADWSVTWRDIPATSFAPVVAGNAVLSFEGHVYAYVVREPGNHDVFLMRWPQVRAAAGALTEPEWWTGNGWTAHASLTSEPAIVIGEAATEMSVHRDAAAGIFVQVQSEGFGATDLVARTAPRPEGPWSARRTVFHPPEGDHDRFFVYAGKAHPELEAGGALAITYAANAWDFWDLFKKEGAEIYWPRFVRWERRD